MLPVWLSASALWPMALLYLQRGSEKIQSCSRDVDSGYFVHLITKCYLATQLCSQEFEEIVTYQMQGCGFDSGPKTAQAPRYREISLLWFK